MNIEQEKMIVESLPSLYPLKSYEEDAIRIVLDALPHWIPVDLENNKPQLEEYPGMESAMWGKLLRLWEKEKTKRELYGGEE